MSSVTNTATLAGSATVTLANGGHGGSSAELTLKKVNVTNGTGNAVEFVSTGSNGHGLYVVGFGTGDGVHWLGGATGHGLNAQGGTTSGDGIHASALGSGVPISGNITGSITGNLSGSVGSLTTNNDKTGYSISGTLTTLDAAWSKIKKYFQLLFRKDAAIATDNATEVTEINASGGSGAGAFANTTDAVEAIRDRGDAAWITATGFSTLVAADIRTAVGLASANLDTQLAAIVADTNELQVDWVNGGRLDLLIDAILADTDSLDTTKITTARAGVLTDWIDGGRLDLILDNASLGSTRLQTMIELDGLVYRYTTNALEQTSVTLSAGDITDIADGVIDGLSGQAIIVNSPFAVGGALTVTTGDSYTAAMGTSITFNLVGRTDLVGLIPHLVGKCGTTFDIAASAVVSGTETMTFADLTGSTTLLLSGAGNPAIGEYQIRFMSGTSKVTETSGILYVRKGLTTS